MHSGRGAGLKRKFVPGSSNPAEHLVSCTVCATHTVWYQSTLAPLCAHVCLCTYTDTHLPVIIFRNMGDVRWTDNGWGESRWILSSSISQGLGMETVHTIWHILNFSGSLFLLFVPNTAIESHQPENKCVEWKQTIASFFSLVKEDFNN